MPLNRSSLIQPVGTIADIRMGATLRGRDATRPDPKGSCCMIRIGDISNDGLLLSNDFLRFSPKDKIKADHFLRPGDVLFPNRGTRTTAFAYDLSEPRTLAGAQFFVLKPDSRKVLPAYLAWFLRSEPAAQHFKERRKGTLVQTIQRHDIAELAIPLPPLATQLKIVELDALATRERRLSAHLAQLRSYYLHHRLLAAAGKSQSNI